MTVAHMLNQQIRDLPHVLHDVTPQEWRQQHQMALSTAVKVCNELANHSSLILDPDLDIVYLTLATCLRLPDFE